MNVRDGAAGDIPAIAAIYAHHVRHGAATFETEPPDAAEMERRWTHVREIGLPWLVAELENGGVAGYAYAGRYRPREAYRFTVEDSIYIDPARTGQGIGSALLERLIHRCEEAGAHQMVAVIGDSANIVSVRIHEKFGFRRAGVLYSVGFKFGHWVDTVLMQRPLGPGNLTLP